jgi:D-glycerate 3-kinase
VTAQDFIERHKLPQAYLHSAQQWFEPLLQQFADRYAADTTTQILGINGSQGSGKSTLADYLCTMIADRHGIKAVSLSMDDFYLTKAERALLADTTHPLLATRGVPGTHDIDLAIRTIEQLTAGVDTQIPRFDKSIDDRVTGDKVEMHRGAAGLIVIEGWCWGAIAQSESELQLPINTLEQTEDPEGHWRHYINQSLAGNYQQLFAMADQLIMLQAPSFDTVYNWRLEQETKLIERLKSTGNSARSGLMSAQQILRFIQYFQRITEHSLQEMPRRAHHLYQLDQQRNIINYKPQSAA